MWYVNNVRCQTEARREELVMFFFAQGQSVEVREVERDEQGRWILPVNDPMEQ